MKAVRSCLVLNQLVFQKQVFSTSQSLVFYPVVSKNWKNSPICKGLWALTLLIFHLQVLTKVSWQFYDLTGDSEWTDTTIKTTSFGETFILPVQQSFNFSVDQNGVTVFHDGVCYMSRTDKSRENYWMDSKNI